MEQQIAQLLLAFWEGQANWEGERKSVDRSITWLLLRDDQSPTSDVQHNEVPEGSSGPEGVELARLFIKSESTQRGLRSMTLFYFLPSVICCLSRQENRLQVALSDFMNSHEVLT